MEEQETIELDISDEEFLVLAKQAHDQDVTFNQYINKILKDYLESLS